MYNSILLLSEGTESGMKAARHAIQVAQNEKASLFVVSVVDTVTLKSLVSSHIFIKDEMAEYEQQMERSCRKQLDYVLSLARKAKTDAEPILHRGAWHSAILSEQKTRSADLLVMGGFKASMAKRDLIAREKQLILDEIKCAVLLVR